jgi:UrcA family protein
MRSKISMFLLSALAATASSLAMADTQVNVKSEVVRYDDVRLISAVGAAVLYGRLNSAAARACGGPLDKQPLAVETRYRACVNDAVAKAVAKVNEPLLTVYFESKTGAPAPSRATPSATAVADAR